MLNLTWTLVSSCNLFLALSAIFVDTAREDVSYRMATASVKTITKLLQTFLRQNLLQFLR